MSCDNHNEQQLSLFDLPEAPASQSAALPEKPVKVARDEPNPCIEVYGPGPAGQTCQGCRQIAGISMSKVYYKCRLRQNTHGKKTDHKLRWPACAKFEPRPEGEPLPIYDGRG
jgi:hypothetical protein